MRLAAAAKENPTGKKDAGPNKDEKKDEKDKKDPQNLTNASEHMTITGGDQTTKTQVEEKKKPIPEAETMTYYKKQLQTVPPESMSTGLILETLIDEIVYEKHKDSLTGGGGSKFVEEEVRQISNIMSQIDYKKSTVQVK